MSKDKKEPKKPGWWSKALDKVGNVIGEVIGEYLFGGYR